MKTIAITTYILFLFLTTAGWSQQKVELPDRGRVGVGVKTGFYGGLGAGLAGFSGYEYSDVSITALSFSWNLEAGYRFSRAFSLLAYYNRQIAPNTEEIALSVPEQMTISSFGGSTLGLGSKVWFGKGSAYLSPVLCWYRFGPNGESDLMISGPGGSLSAGYSNNITGILNYDLRLFGRYGKMSREFDAATVKGSAFLMGFELAIIIGP